MAYRHRQIRPETGDIISPEDLNANNREYVEEFNGMLDRDNFDENIFTTKEIKRNAFNKFYSFRADMPFKQDTSSFFILNGTNTSWHYQDTNDVYVSMVEFEAHTDGVLICEWHANWELENAKTKDQGLAADDPQVVSFRMLANGTVIAKSFRNIDAPSFNGTAMYGCFQCPAGPVKVLIQARTYRVKGSNVLVAEENASTPRTCTIKQRELIVNFRKR